MNGIMNALNVVEPNQPRMEERPIPPCPPGHALLRMEAIGICGSDIHAYSGKQPYFTYPRVLGHELCATVAETNGDGGFAVGERVTAVPYMPCGTCPGCRHGLPNACTAMTTIGVHVDGGLMEYVAVPFHALVKVPDIGLTAEEVAMIEPFAIGAHTARRAAADKGDSVLICGAGPIGVATAEFLKDAGARVVFSELSDGRAKFVRDRFGYAVFNPAAEDFEARLYEFCGGDPADIVVDATGSKRSMDQSYRYIRSGGRVVFVGLFPGKFEIDDPYFHTRESELRISRTATRADFDTVLDALRRKAVNIGAYISHRGSFADMLETLPQWIADGVGVFKGVALFA